jgi:hypothetical protein
MGFSYLFVEGVAGVEDSVCMSAHLISVVRYATHFTILYPS